jgi:hypothetical protein
VDKPGSVCLKAGRVRMFGAKLKLTPDVKCRIVGDVTRGPIRLSSRDDKLHLAMPVAATLEAALGFCLGCKVFAVLMRLGLIPDDVCAECNDLSLRYPDLAGAEG